MLLPEDVYRALMLEKSSNQVNCVGSGSQSLKSAESVGADALSTATEQMMSAALQSEKKHRKRRAGGGTDSDVIKFMQLYKRYRKLLQEELERPTNVNVRNLDELEARLQARRAANYAKHNKSNTNNVHQPQHSRAASSVTEKTITLNEDDDVDDDEVFMDARSSVNAAAPSSFFAGFQEPAERKHSRRNVLDYLTTNAAQLGLTEALQLQRPVQGVMVPVKSSDINKILDYHFSSPETRTLKQPPAAYTRFIQLARQDEYLRRHLFSEHQQSSTSKAGSTLAAALVDEKPMLTRHQRREKQSGSGGSGGGRRHANKKQHHQHVKRFKPMLW